MTSGTKNKNNTLSILAKIFLGVFIILIFIQKFFPGFIPLDTFQLWSLKTNLWETAIISSWILFIWSVVMAIISFVRNKKYFETNKSKTFADICFAAFFIALVEEMSFRWLLLFNIIWIVKLINLIFYQLIDFNIFLLLHPAIEIMTFSYIDEIAYPFGWSVQMSIIFANIIFTISHFQQKRLGMVSAWFVGLYFFYIALQYDIVICMIIHLLYNMTFNLTQLSLAKLTLER